MITSDKKTAFLFVVLNLIIINGVTLAVMNLRYPLVGHDYTYAIPNFLDTALHYRLNGLSIQWFTPTFGGGLPAFPNPNDMQFSIPALLATILPPWTAIMASAVLYTTVGFLACYYFFLHVLKLNWTASLLGAFFFSANGFVITRIAVGHLGYFSFTLMALLLIFLFDEHLSAKIAAISMGLLAAMCIHFAGFFIIIIFGLSILVLMPILFLYKPELFHWKRLFSILVTGGVIGLIISASKLAAILAFMRHFPRPATDNYPVSFFVGFLGIILQLLGTQTLVPFFIFAGMDPSIYPNYVRAATGTNYGMWELDDSMTPLIYAIMLIGFIKFIHNPRKYLRLLSNNQKKIALLLFVLFTYIAMEFILAKGIIYPAMRHLPILSSLRANVRFAATFIFPLSFIAATVYNYWCKTWDQKKILRTFLLVNLCAAVPLGSYFLFKQDMFWMFYDIAAPQQIYHEMQAGQSFEITDIGTPSGNNTGALLYRTSNLNVYEPIFGINRESYHPQVKGGSIWNISDGYYNMTDPTSFVYPDLNNNKPFDRFRIADQGTLKLFVKHLQPNWKIPTYQKVLDWVSGITFMVALFYIFIQIIINKRK